LAISIDLGCGNCKSAGRIGFDRGKMKGVDVVCDLDYGVPLKDNSVEEVYTSHFLEHTENYVHLMEEIYRVSKPAAKVKIVVPYYKSILAFQDPTHKHFFTENTFDYFTKDPNRRRPKGSSYGFKCDFKIVYVRLIYIGVFSWLRFIPFRHFLPFNVANQLEALLVAMK
jgi:hypothetical protein